MDEVAEADLQTSQERTERGGVLPRGWRCVRRIFSNVRIPNDPDHHSCVIPITVPG